MAPKLSTIFVYLLIAWSFCFDATVAVAPPYRSTEQATTRRAHLRGVVKAIAGPSAFNKKSSFVHGQKQASNFSIRDGLTLDPCTTDDDCVAPRVCIEPNTEESCNFETTCICFDFAQGACESSADCTSGEICAIIPELGFNFCVSEEVAEEVGFEEVGSESPEPFPNQ